MTKDTSVIDALIDELSEDEQAKAREDMLLHGSCFLMTTDAGTVEHIPFKGVLMTDEKETDDE